MSYARMGADSDVYVYWGGADDRPYWTCCGCSLGPDPFVYSRREMVDHLHAHQARGHRVPAHAFARLEDEIAAESAEFSMAEATKLELRALLREAIDHIAESADAEGLLAPDIVARGNVALSALPSEFYDVASAALTSRPEDAALERVTAFDGHASGDGECFCFDKRTPEQWAKDQELPGHARAALEIEQAPQIYPDDLLPDGVGERMGRWTITVRFEPRVR